MHKTLLLHERFITINPVGQLSLLFFGHILVQFLKYILVVYFNRPCYLITWACCDSPILLFVKKKCLLVLKGNGLSMYTVS